MTQDVSVISGVVRDNNGNEISGATVSFISGPVPLPDIGALTDTNGTFALSAPAPGNYIIQANAAGFIRREAKVAVESGQEKHIQLNLLIKETKDN